MSTLWFRKPYVDFWHFWVFTFCHRAYSEIRKPRKIFITSFFEILRLYIRFRALFYAFCVFKTQISKCCSKLSVIIYYCTLKVAFLTFKPKWFSNFLVAATVKNGFFLFRELFVDFRHFRVFVFYHRAYLKSWNTRKIFISSFFKDINTDFMHFSRQSTYLDTTLKVLLKVINWPLLLKLESSFSCC